jgi:hypothetical protein
LPRAVEDAHDFDAGFDWSIKDYIIADREHPEVRAHIRSRHSKAWRFAKISTAKGYVVEPAPRRRWIIRGDIQGDIRDVSLCFRFEAERHRELPSGAS